MTGLFIALEGGEGAGKTTQLNSLAFRLADAGHDVLITREPGDTPLGAALRRLLLDSEPGSIEPRAEALLYAADRAQHVARVIRPALAAGQIVLCDRYIDSSIAYQAAGRHLGREAITYMSMWAAEELLPDLTVLLDIQPRAGLDRVHSTRPADRMELEELAFHHRVRRCYLALARENKGRYLVVDATLPVDEVTDTVWRHLTDRIER